jgi:hypothetical protein
MRKIMRRLTLGPGITIALLVLALGGCSFEEEVLFLVDSSSSMTSPAELGGENQYTRWEVVQAVFPEWLNRLPPWADVGVIDVGGSCGDSPRQEYPIGTSRQRLKKAIAGTVADGETNLNRMLERSVEYFSAPEGKRRVVILSDGGNTCPPLRSTCDIARDLYQVHGVQVDAVLFRGGMGMEEEYRCIVNAASGRMIIPDTELGWKTIEFRISLFPQLLSGLALLALAYGALIVYRQGVHAWQWPVPMARLLALLTWSIGGLLVYGAVFGGLGSGVVFTVVTMFVVLCVAMTWHSRRAARQSWQTTAWPLALAAVFLGSMAGSEEASASSPLCTSQVSRNGPPRHHVLVQDASGSVRAQLGEMKAFALCYAQAYARPRDLITVMGFGYRKDALPKVLGKITVPASGSLQELKTILDGIAVENIRKTWTVFSAVAEEVDRYLRHEVTMNATVLVISDGRSDERTTDIKFEDLGKVYRVPGIENGRQGLVAVTGGEDLDLAPLFDSRTSEAISRSGVPKNEVTQRIDPCLARPTMRVDGADVLRLDSSLIPFAGKPSGELSLAIRNDCEVTRRAEGIEISLEVDGERHLLERLSTGVISEKPRRFRVPVKWEWGSPVPTEAIVRVGWQGGLAENSATKTIVIENPSYFEAHRFFFTGLLFIGLFGGIGGTGLLLYGRQRKRRRPLFIKTVGGNAVAITPGTTASIGGRGADLTLDDAPPRVTFASVERKVNGEALNITPLPGIKMRIGGINALPGATYRLGDSLEFVDADGECYSATLVPASGQEIFGGDSFGGLEAEPSLDDDPFGVRGAVGT